MANSAPAVYGKDGGEGLEPQRTRSAQRNGKLFPCTGYSCNSLQIICNFYVSPAGQQVPNAFSDGSTDLKHQPSAWTKRCTSLRNQPFNYFQTSGTSEDCSPRLEFSHFELHLVFFGLTDVRRIGDDEVEFFGG